MQYLKFVSQNSIKHFLRNSLDYGFIKGITMSDIEFENYDDYSSVWSAKINCGLREDIVVEISDFQI